MAETLTFWNGEPCEARIVRVVVADAPGHSAYWARPYVGHEREAVEVTYKGEVFYLDNEEHTPGDAERVILAKYGLPAHTTPAGEGWAKVTAGGGPALSHRSLRVERIVEPRDPSDTKAAAA